MTQNFETKIKEKTDDELSEIYLNSNNYQIEFIQLVELELEKRKIPINSLKFIKDKKDKISSDTLLLGVQGNIYWITAMFFASLFGGLIGIIAGYIYAYSKHKNIKGDEYFYYNESTRKYGRWMLIVGCTVLGLLIFSTLL
jgi:hypothetical protein